MLPRKPDGRNKENGEWTEVRGRKQTNTSMKVITSYYVTNIPDGTCRYTLKEAFKNFGNIIDVYIPGRKDKGGAYFGFVKFCGVKNAEELERSMQRVKCGHNILKVNISKYRKQNHSNKAPEMDRERDIPVPPPSQNQKHNAWEINREGRTYADVAGAQKRTSSSMNTGIQHVALKHVPAMMAWNSYALVREVLSLHHLTELPKLLEAECKYSKNLFYAGGMRVVIRFDLPKDAEIFLREENNWNRLLKWLRMGVFDEPNIERLAWIKITGVPISLRAEENFTLIANLFGEALQVEGQNWHNLDLSYDTACIITSSLTRINSMAICTFNNKSYKVGIVEYGYNWHPFFHNTASPQAEKEQEEGEESDDSDSAGDLDDDGTSDTWVNPNNDDLEDGEINQNMNSEIMNIDGGAIAVDDPQFAEMLVAEMQNPPEAEMHVPRIIGDGVGAVMAGDESTHIHTLSTNDTEKVSKTKINDATQQTKPIPQIELEVHGLKFGGPKSNKQKWTQNISTPIKLKPNHFELAPDFELGDSLGKRRKVDRNFAATITPRRIFDPPLTDFHRSKSNSQQVPLASHSDPLSLDLNKTINIFEALSCNSTTNEACSSFSNEIDSTIRIGNELGFQIGKEDDIVGRVFDGVGALKNDQ
ncbi:unnamed protein product [Lactuca virosa]|uniref:RRM domain-containing protein n=1 Tax=Lactuca virosa TaxID=75947 RepID=A0AAU9PPX2_9ASTR|nr:unnamed protein product [Lactuca virosa]